MPEGEHLLLAAGQVGGRLVEPPAEHREQLEHLGHAPRARPSASWRRQPAGHPQVLGHRQRREDAGAAGHLGDAVGRRPRWAGRG